MAEWLFAGLKVGRLKVVRKGRSLIVLSDIRRRDIRSISITLASMRANMPRIAPIRGNVTRKAAAAR